MEQIDIIKKIEEHEDRIRKLEELLIHKEPVAESTVKRDRSMRELFNGFSFKTETDKTLVVMRVIELFKNKNKVTAKDVLEGFKELREKGPNNVFDKLQMLDKRAFIMADGKEGTTLWVITNSGIEYLEKLKKNS